MAMNGLYIDYEYCTGCHSCEIACRNEMELGINDFGIKVLEDKPRQNPDGAWHWDYIAYPTELCDLCTERVEAGGIPACVMHCQAKVLYYGTLDELTAQMESKGSKGAIFIP